jgi:hypothetical protein
MEMKKILGMIVILAIVTSIATDAAAKRERKEQPNSRAAKEAVEAAGGEHYPEKIKIKRVSSVEVGETYYHIYEGELDKLGFHIIIFDNYKNYLGYYTSDYPPTNNEVEGSIVLDSGDVDDDGEQKYFLIPIDLKKGPPGKVSIGGMPSAFVKAPLPEGAKTGTPSANGEQAGTEAVADEVPGPEYRDWIIIHKGKKIPARAIFVKFEAGKVYLKLEANGAEKGFALHTLSREDQAYVKQFK